MRVLRRPDQHVALGVVIVLFGLGLVLVTTGLIRAGVGVMAGALWLGAAIRTFAPVQRQGILAVRSRTIDLAALVGLAAALTVLAIVIPVRE